MRAPKGRAAVLFISFCMLGHATFNNFFVIIRFMNPLFGGGMFWRFIRVVFLLYIRFSNKNSTKQRVRETGPCLRKCVKLLKWQKISFRRKIKMFYSLFRNPSQKCGRESGNLRVHSLFTCLDRPVRTTVLLSIAFLLNSRRFERSWFPEKVVLF